jgi:hypothetical protein
MNIVFVLRLPRDLGKTVRYIPRPQSISHMMSYWAVYDDTLTAFLRASICTQNVNQPLAIQLLRHHKSEAVAGVRAEFPPTKCGVDNAQLNRTSFSPICYEI